MAKKQLTKLKIYPAEDHPHKSQDLKILDMEKINKKKIKLIIKMNENIKISKDAIYATGKESIARVWILKGDGKITINGKKYNEYFKRPVHQLVIEKPFDITKTKNNYDIFAQ